MSNEPAVLAGDIGGTKTILALCRAAAAPRIERERSFASAAHAGLAEIVRDFLAGEGEPVAAAAFGVAGPVLDGRARITNLPWVIDARELQQVLGGAPVRLMNDMEATARGALGLDAGMLEVLHAGAPRAGNRALVGVGTGLGEAILVWDGVAHRPLATEGGHVSFAPRGDEEIELLRFLAARVGHVSAERVLSGDGLANLFAFATEVRGIAAAPALRAQLGKGDDNAAIGAAGVAGSCPASAAAVRSFARLLAEHCTDLALAAMAVGGIYLGGGVPPKLLPVLRRDFAPSFANAGRMSELVRGIPVWVVLEPKSALRGALQAAVEAAALRA